MFYIIQQSLCRGVSDFAPTQLQLAYMSDEKYSIATRDSSLWADDCLSVRSWWQKVS